MRYHLFNIGSPRTDAWWHRHIDESFISAGFDNKPERGEKTLKSMAAGDCVLAYANKHGVLGLGVVGNEETYRFITDDSLPADFESTHRHFRAVEWQIHVADLTDAVPYPQLNLNGPPRNTRIELEPENARRIVELLAANPRANSNIFPSEITATGLYTEGAVETVLVNRFERNLKARAACIQHWGVACFCCGMDFKAVYGEVGDGFIHVHHLRPLSEIGVNYCVDPVNDLRPVCPNCHAMLHRNPAASIASLRDRFKLTVDARQ